MKLYCPYSAVSYKTNIGNGHGKIPHPMFQLPIQALIMQNLDRFTVGQLAPADLHLFGCALLKQFPVIWNAPLREQVCVPMWRKNGEKLAALAMRYTDKDIDSLPKYHITSDNCKLENLHHYLDAVESELNSCSIYKDDLDLDSASLSASYMRDPAEETILGILRGAMAGAKNKKLLPGLMAEWASDVGNFPSTSVNLLGGKTTTLRDHWKTIISQLFSFESPVDILSVDITIGDIDELIEHCESSIDIGSIHSLALFKRLRTAKSMLDEFKSPVRLKEIKQAAQAETLLGDLLGETENGSENGAATPASIPKKPSKPLHPGEPDKRKFPTLQGYISAKLIWIKSLTEEQKQSYGVK